MYDNKNNTILSLEEKQWCVYMHINKINGKRYVGITSKTPKKRWGNNGNGYRKNQHFWNAIQKYGWDSFEHNVLLTNETFEHACKVERCLIKHYKSNNPIYGYNLTSGGEQTSGVVMSDEAKMKMSEAQKKRLANPESHPLYGTHITEEHKQKISNANKGKKMPKESCENMSKNRIGTKNGRAKKPVYCPELNELFWGAKAVEEKYGFHNADITAACKGKHKHCGRHPTTNELLTWVYVDQPIAIKYMIDILNQVIVKEVNINESA